MTEHELESLGFKIKEIWNNYCNENDKILNPIMKITFSRLLKIAKTTDEFKWDVHDWEMYFDRVFETPFLLGEGGWGWKTTFDWLIILDNAVKVMEGNYTAKEKDDDEHEIDIDKIQENPPQENVIILPS